MMFCKTLFFNCLFLIAFFTLNAQQKRIENITIIGAKKTKIAEIKKLLNTKEGRFLDTILLQEDLVFLKRLPAISNASFKIISTNNNNCNVHIQLEENYTLLPDVNFWTTTNQNLAYKIGVYDYNFLGRNIAFGGFYQRNNFNSYGINFKAPSLFSKKWGLALNHQDWKSEEPLYFDDKTANYLYNNVSFEALALYQINLKNSIDFGATIFTEHYKFLSGDIAATVPRNLKLNKLLFKLLYSYNNLNYFYHTVSGFKNDFYAQYVVTENDFQNNFLIAWNDFFYYKAIGENGNWANRVRFGLSSNEKSPFAPFALDNNVNLRGVGILIDRGTGSFVANTEYRHTVYNKKWLTVQTNTFADFGSWRNPGGKMSDFYKSENLKMYTGFGLRFISKKIYNATFRIDYGIRVLGAKNSSSGGFVFGLGQYF